MHITRSHAAFSPPSTVAATRRAARRGTTRAEPGNLATCSADGSHLVAPPTASPACRPAPASTAPAAEAERRARIAATKARSWHDEIIYMALTDRFYNGDGSNDIDICPDDPERFHGGDWQGLIEKLDYLADLGVTTLWISPTPEQIRDFMGKDGFHGYWTRDFSKPEPSFGDMAKLRELVDKAHERGLKVLVDLVVNHLGYGAPMADDPAFDGWFHHHGDANLTLQHNMEKGRLNGLPDLAQENPLVARWLIDQCKAWIDATDIDGFRLDAVRHVPIDFWKQLSAEIHAHAGDGFLLLGEVYDPRPSKVARFQNAGGMDAVFDFPLNFALRNSIGNDKPMRWWQTLGYLIKHLGNLDGETLRLAMGRADGDMRRVARTVEQDATYRRADMLVTLLDNHDMPRFTTIAGAAGEQKLKLGLALLMTMRGIPSIYYGTEVAMRGEGSHVRDDMAFGSRPEVEQAFRQLATIRQGSVALRRGSFEALHVDRDVYAYARCAPSQTVVVALNNGKQAQHREVPAPSGLPDGSRLQDLLGGSSCLVHDGRIAIDLEANQACILAPTRPTTG